MLGTRPVRDASSVTPSSPPSASDSSSRARSIDYALAPGGGSRVPARRQRKTGVGSEKPLSFFAPASDHANASSPASSRTVPSAISAPGAGALGQARREVDRAAVVVAPAPQRRAVRGARVERGELLALALGRLHQPEHRVEQRRRLGRDEHDGVADRLDQPHGRLGDVGGERREPRRDRAEVGRGDALAQAREADDVAEADRHLVHVAAHPRDDLVGRDDLLADVLAVVEHVHDAEQLRRVRRQLARRGAQAVRVVVLGVALLRDREVGERARRRGGVRGRFAEHARCLDQAVDRQAARDERRERAGAEQVELPERGDVARRQRQARGAPHRLERLEVHARPLRHLGRRRAARSRPARSSAGSSASRPSATAARSSSSATPSSCSDRSSASRASRASPSRPSSSSPKSRDSSPASAGRARSGGLTPALAPEPARPRPGCRSARRCPRARRRAARRRARSS